MKLRCASFGICWKKHHLGKAIFAEVNAHLKSQGMKLSTGTIVDTSIINAPSSKNKERQRAPEMHQIKKGNQWYRKLARQVDNG
jgi:hypothetical protein